MNRLPSCPPPPTRDSGYLLRLGTAVVFLLPGVLASVHDQPHQAGVWACLGLSIGLGGRARQRNGH